MSVFDTHDFDAHELVAFGYDSISGLKAIIAVHSTVLGPAIGGCRFWPYASEADALKDVLRLARGMTYKAALADLKHGGGKAVIIGDPKTEKSPEKLLAFGRFVEKLNGIYITAEDVGTNTKDMGIIRQESKHVLGTDSTEGGSGDPSSFTALGVLIGIRACVLKQLGKSDLAGVRIGVSGLGHVGSNLVARLAKEGAFLVLTDINESLMNTMARQYDAATVSPNDIFDADIDVFAPCALGGILNDATIGRLKCKIVAGSANNQLDEARHAKALEDRGILYAPDYVINAGGLINVTYEGPQYDAQVVNRHIEKIYETLLRIFSIASEGHITPSEAADLLAKERLYTSSKK